MPGTARSLPKTIPPERAFLVFDGKGRLWGASDGAVRWLERAGAEAELATELRRFRAERRTSAQVVLNLGEVRITRLGARTGARFLVELPSRSERTANEKLLSKMQLQVARRAAEGATLQEIALEIGRSPDTVRSHLREVYRRLDCASRLELSRALAEPEPT